MVQGGAAMIPDLGGRWQVRIFLFIVVGLPVTALYGIWAAWVSGLDFGNTYWVLYSLLFTILILGLILDPIYIWIQGFRWDYDWPFAYQLFFSFIEFGLAYFVASQGWLPWLDSIFFELDGMLRIAIGHFLWVFGIGFLGLLGLIQIFFVRWRFKAGRFGRL